VRWVEAISTLAICDANRLGFCTMLNSIRRSFGSAVRASLRPLGRVLVPAPSPWGTGMAGFKRIAALNPDVILDIGASEGEFGETIRSIGFRGRIISFEPQPGPFGLLSKRAAVDSNWECFKLALGRAPASLTMHVSQTSQSSSLLPISVEHVALMPNTVEVGVEMVQVMRLDEWAKGRELEGKKLFIKLDVQGYELPALEGAGDLLKLASGALVELNFAKLFEGQSSYCQVMSTLEEAGLRFVSFSNIFRDSQNGNYLWADALFLRDRGLDRGVPDMGYFFPG
jgi:FkbM family methyltransferase